MATRSTIAVQQNDGSIQQVYCHWDGDSNYAILKEHYNNIEKANELISHGDMSSLGNEIGDANDFVNRDYNKCVFYARDRGEPLSINKFKNISDYKKNGQIEEYTYLFKDAVWLMLDTKVIIMLDNQSQL